jgi:exosortase F-associated protein
MLQSRMNRIRKVVLVSLLILLLVLIRFFESDLFYDPFIAYFKKEFSSQPYPYYSLFKLVFNLKLRYILNSLLSIGVIYVIFENNSMVKIASLLLFIFLIALLVFAVILLTFFDHNQAMVFFYVRRFLIQPLFLILFIPGFYYQRKNS